ncbi:SCO family protein [Caldimonas tepidiphila]|uniref:SCO family protein n=1 Tax=Caldimonas tepidiphila TaxID=2315841 RepID=UPI0013008EE1|nr:SCO family protein [Caldimonas tepidiphila]
MRPAPSRLRALGCGLTLAAAACAAPAHEGHRAAASPSPAASAPPAAPERASPPAAAAMRRAPAEAKAEAGRYFTDTELLTQDGRPLRFYSDVLKDRVVLINFVYTECGEACPMITQQLSRVKDELGERFGRDVRFVSISLDPARDTPQVLRGFAAKHGAVHPEWLFLTGAPRKVEQVLRRLGGHTDTLESHNTALLAGNLRTGHWRRLQPNLPPAVIAAHLRLLAGDGAQQP